MERARIEKKEERGVEEEERQAAIFEVVRGTVILDWETRRVERVCLSSRSPSQRCTFAFSSLPPREPRSRRPVTCATWKKVKRRKGGGGGGGGKEKRKRGRKKREEKRASWKDPVHRWRIFAPKAA